MAKPIANPTIPIGSTTQNWPNIDSSKAHPEVARAIKLLYNSVDDHNQAFTSLASQLGTINSNIAALQAIVDGGTF
ncbi:MAG TPA: hypothetical protein VJY15_13360 [Candidatus Acidoferrum sp.]|nr:hypothetical protein [Candidatus Acidoferrum sp.]